MKYTYFKPFSLYLIDSPVIVNLLSKYFLKTIFVNM